MEFMEEQNYVQLDETIFLEKIIYQYSIFLSECISVLLIKLKRLEQLDAKLSSVSVPVFPYIQTNRATPFSFGLYN